MLEKKGGQTQSEDSELPMTPRRPFYLTTPIYYVNDVPHIGHAYTTIAADTLSRFHRLAREDVFFLTGTDEHGQKVERAAHDQGLQPKELANQVVGRFQSLWDRLNIQANDFIRTTQSRHRRAVEALFLLVRQRGDIYLGDYEGWYCTQDESFWTETQVQGGKCPECGRPVERLKEKSYFFRMSRYQEPLPSPYRGPPGIHPPREPAKRDPALCRGRPSRPQHQSHIVPLGNPGPRRPGPHPVRLVRCLDELPLGRWLSGRGFGGGPLGELLAGGPPPRPGRTS